MTEGFDAINRTIVNMAKKFNSSPYVIILQGITFDDIDLKISIISFLNWMIFSCPSQKKLVKFLARLENLGIYDDLRELAKEKND